MSLSDKTAENYRPGPHRVAVVAAAFTWPLIFVGGLVTTYRVGMAVPDWPTTFGINMFLYNFRNAAWGVFVEHGHRLYGAAVGLATLTLAGWFLAAEPRRWLKALGVLALLAVIGQGVLGGYRVRWNSTDLAALHGCTAQAFFGLMVALCVFTGRGWSGPVTRSADPGFVRELSALTVLAVYAQVVLGAWLRHFPSAAALGSHSGSAALVFGLAGLTSYAALRQRGVAPELAPSAWALVAAVVVQVALGLAAWWVLRPFDGTARYVTSAQALVRTGHQANGALLLASAVVLALRTFRRFAAARPSGRPLDLEAVA